MALGSLGKITVASAGTPRAVSVTQKLCNSFLVQALPSNTGKIYIGLSGLNKATMDSVVAVLGAPTTNIIPTFSATIPLSQNGVELSELYLDVDTNGEGGIVSYLVA